MPAPLEMVLLIFIARVRTTILSGLRFCSFNCCLAINVLMNASKFVLTVLFERIAQFEESLAIDNKVSAWESSCYAATSEVMDKIEI